MIIDEVRRKKNGITFSSFFKNHRNDRGKEFANKAEWGIH
jgi:hypothetical protein